MAASLRLKPAIRPLDGVVAVPGSKSIANRALVCAALASDETRLTNVPGGDDTLAMVGCLAGLGVAVTLQDETATISGSGGALAARDVHLDAGLAGTTSRFVTALAALAPGPVVVDGAPPLRRRPMLVLHEALRTLGAGVTSAELPGTLPVTIEGPLSEGGAVAVAGDVSSQYLTALMMIGPYLDGGLRLELTTPLVSEPYVRLTAAVMADFGVDHVEVGSDHIVVPEGRYLGIDLAIEADASSASYPLAMAAVAGGRVTVGGLSETSPQGDAAFAGLLEAMGCRRVEGPGITIERDLDEPLHGIDVDMADISDLVPSVAAVAATALSPTTIRGVGFIRAKESDRLGDLATELGKLGARVAVTDDGLRIEPSTGLHGGRVATHHDHRLAMAFGVLGTFVPDVEVLEPEVVSKSWPGFWEMRRDLIGRT